MNDFNFNNTIGGKLLKKYEVAIQECITVPNHLLPEEMHDNVRECRTLKRLEKMCNKRDKNSEHKQKKATKARNIKLLAAQVADGQNDIDQPLDWSKNECDDMQLTKNMQAMVGGLINGGMLDVDDILESNFDD
jgi:hypothetical protein